MSGSEKRGARRFDISLPVKVRRAASESTDSEESTSTRNVSASGVYLSLPEKVELGSELEWEMTLSSPLSPGEIRILCRGKIIRVEPPDANGRVGVAASLQSYEFLRNHE